MQQFAYQLSSWWFATMTPVLGSLNTIEARETMRKRRLLSFILLIACLALLCVGVGMLLAGVSKTQQIQPLLAGGTILAALWINKRGYLKSASLLYLLSSFIGIAILIVTFSLNIPAFSLGIWPIHLVILISSGLFLPTWGPILLTAMTNLFVCWFMLSERQSQIAIYLTHPGDRLLFLLLTCMIISCVGGFCAIATAATKKAVIQADRTVDLEQSNQALAQAHKNLEVMYSKLETAHATIQQQALTDGLTGLPNHRAIIDHLEKELDRARRYGHPFSVLFFDADHFKQVNDTYGHAAGDTVLRQIGERAKSGLRGGDTVGRFGGEEFVVILPEADECEAKIAAERIRADVATQTITMTEGEEGIAMTVSVGVATYPSDGDTEQAIIARADEAMYVAKRLGRNQVRTTEDVRQTHENLELLALLQTENQHGIRQEGISLEQLRETYEVRMIDSLLSLLERRDERLYAHAHTVSKQARVIANALKIEPAQVSRIVMAALIHDIGKVALPDLLLHKVSHLSPYERMCLKEHPKLGEQILEASPFLDDLIPAVRHHHERWDGCGYPDQLAGEDIPLAARVISVAEAYDTILKDYAFSDTRNPRKAMEELWRCAGTQFDPMVVQALAEGLESSGERYGILQAIS